MERVLTPLEERRVVALRFYQEKFKPRPGQLKMGDALFNQGKKIIFLRYGRNGGKSFGAAACMVKFAIENDNVQVYYFAPLAKQAANIVWKPRLLHNLIHPDFIQRTDKDEMYIELINGSFIQCDGSSQDPDVVRGYKPDLVVADEYSQFKSYWQEAMFPNLAAKDAALILIGTPPEFPITDEGTKHHYVQMDEECREYFKSPKNTRVYWASLPTWEANPEISREWLHNEKNRLFSRGEDYVWFREYGAKIVSGASRQIFSMFNKDTHVVAHEGLCEQLGRQPERYEWWVGADPGTRGVFAVVFIAVDHYSGMIYWVDEIYETDASNTIASIMNQAILEKCEELAANEEWRFICDIAGAPYIEESAQEPDYPIYWDETQKELKDKANGISLLKEVFTKSVACMSENCFFTANEFVRYQRDKAGRIPKKHDHTIDASRYVGKESGFTLSTKEFLGKKGEGDPEENNFLRNAEETIRRWTKGEDFWSDNFETYH